MSEEFFGELPPVDACRSLAAELGISPLEAARALLNGTALGLLEQRGPFLCNSCGGSLGYSQERCRCGRQQPGQSRRDTPVPKPTLNGVDAMTQLRRRRVDPSMLG